MAALTKSENCGSFFSVNSRFFYIYTVFSAFVDLKAQALCVWALTKCESYELLFVQWFFIHCSFQSKILVLGLCKISQSLCEAFPKWGNLCTFFSLLILVFIVVLKLILSLSHL